MNPMEKSLEPTNFSTRLKNALKNMVGYSKVNTLEDVVKRYAEDPVNLERDFLRTPNAGRATWRELHRFLEDNAFTDETVGRITLISQTDAARYRRSIDEALAHVDASDRVYRDLRRVQDALKSSTVMIEQANDTRSEFTRE